MVHLPTGKHCMIHLKLKPGRTIVVADGPSRVHFKHSEGKLLNEASQVYFINTSLSQVDISMVKEVTAKDPVMNLLKNMICILIAKWTMETFTETY